MPDALRRALRLAARGRYRVAPNPMVGAVLTRDGVVVGEGHHRRVGGPHAEVEALLDAGEAARGATLWVTLEPCRHHGRTPPCVEAVIAAGVRRVVACHPDPDPRMRGAGFEALRRAGIQVEVGPRLEDAVRLNLRYLVPLLLGRPQVTLKWAMSLDGRIATARGDSRWISSPGGRRWGLGLREEHDAILVGIGTVLADDPRLDRRLGRAPGPIARVVLDRRLRLPPGAAMLGVAGGVVVYSERPDAARADALRARGAEVVTLDRVGPEAVLADLMRRGVGSLLVEGGAGVHGAFVAAGTWDRVAIDCAPLLVGGRGAPGPVGGDGFGRLDAAPRLEGMRVGRRGEDLIVEGWRRGCSRELSRKLAS